MIHPRVVYMSQDLYDVWLTSIGEKMLDKAKEHSQTNQVDTKCCCGGDTVGSAYHSDYCPKYISL